MTQLQKILGGTTYTVGYQYNEDENVTSTTYPSAKVIQRSFDAIGRLSSIANGSTNYVSSVGYNSNFQLTGFNFGNGVSLSQTFSPDRAQLTGISHVGPGGNVVSLSYSRTQNGGNNGEITSVTDGVDSGRSATYTYDALGRLSTAITNGSANYPQWGLSFTYDRYGNRTAQTVTAGTAYSNVVAVSATTNQITTSGYSYDASGNMTSDGYNTLAYDAENRVVTSSDGGSGSYGYDGHGLRVQKSVAGSTTVYVYDGSNVIAEYASGASPSSPTAEYVYMGSRVVSQLESGVTTYYHPDDLSNRALTDSSGNVLGQLGDFPFGESWYDTETLTNVKFTTYERDTESGNDYAKFRYHANRLGRFMTGDPIRPAKNDSPQRLNRYAYVGNDPIDRVDHLGKEWPPWCMDYGFGTVSGIAAADIAFELDGYDNYGGPPCLLFPFVPVYQQPQHSVCVPIVTAARTFATCDGKTENQAAVTVGGVDAPYFTNVAVTVVDHSSWIGLLGTPHRQSFPGSYTFILTFLASPTGSRFARGSITVRADVECENNEQGSRSGSRTQTQTVDCEN